MIPQEQFEAAQRVIKSREKVISTARWMVMGDETKLDLRVAVWEMIEAEADLASLIKEDI